MPHSSGCKQPASQARETKCDSHISGLRANTSAFNTEDPRISHPVQQPQFARVFIAFSGVLPKRPVGHGGREKHAASLGQNPGPTMEHLPSKPPAIPAIPRLPCPSDRTTTHLENPIRIPTHSRGRNSGWKAMNPHANPVEPRLSCPRSHLRTNCTTKGAERAETQAAPMEFECQKPKSPCPP